MEIFVKLSFIVIVFLIFLLPFGSAIVRRRNVRKFQDTNIRDFLRIYCKVYNDNVDEVTRERENVAHILGVPLNKLLPDITFKSLSDKIGFVGEFETGMGQLEDELIESSEKADIPFPDTFPSTIADYIHCVIEVKHKGKRNHS